MAIEQTAAALDTTLTPHSMEALRAADRAVQNKDYRGAIELLMSANRHQRNKHLEQRIIDLRIAAFGAMDWPAPTGHWPPPASGQFKGYAGLPVISPDELNVATLRSGILEAGGLIVRGLMSADLVRTMRDNIDHALTARRDYATGKVSETTDEWFCRSNKVAGGPVQFGAQSGEKYTESGSVWSADSPRTAFELLEFYRHIGLPELLEEYFDEAAVLSVKKWVLRRVKPNNGNKAGWHQDGRFLGDGIRTVNMWVALNECGENTNSPGMDIVAGPDKTIYETGTQGAVFDWTVGQGLVDEIGKTAPVLNPHFQAGDALFFDHYNLHRTGFGMDHTEDRYALESWFFAASRAPLKQMPVVL